MSLDVALLTKRFGARIAVDQVSFTAQPGEIVGLLGPNGAGKTTTIRMLTTVLPTTSGTFHVAGIPASRPMAIRQRIGVLAESAGYPARQTGSEYLRYHARLFGAPRHKAAAIAEGLLADVGLAERASSRIGGYSRGMRQRLGIARALVNDPVVVFLDEPTLGLDPAGQRQVLGLIRDIAARRGATVVVSTHLLPEVEEICTKVLVLDRGRIVGFGTVAELTRASAARRIARLRVPVDLVSRATETLAGIAGVTVESTDAADPPGTIRLALDGRPNGSANVALQALIETGVAVLHVDVESRSLSDAFLAMTNGANGVGA